MNRAIHLQAVLHDLGEWLHQDLQVLATVEDVLLPRHLRHTTVTVHQERDLRLETGSEAARTGRIRG